MTQVAKLETRFLDRVFGDRLISIRAIIVSLGFSITSLGVVGLLHSQRLSTMSYDFFNFKQSLGLLCIGIYAFVAMSIVRARRVLLFVVLTLVLLVPGWILIIANTPIRHPSASNAISTLELYFVYDFLLTFLGALGFVCDLAFIAVTRKLIRRVSRISSSLAIIMLLLANVVLAVLLVGPYLIERLNLVPSNRVDLLWFPLLGLTNMCDAVLALLFALLAALLLIHRFLWPLLTRTLFRMQDIGTKGRRAILTTVGIALLGTSVFGGKFPELMAKLIEKFGG